MVQRREVWLIMVAAPLVGIEMLVMVKSGLSASSITMLVAPGLGDVLRQVLEQVLQLRVVRGDGDVRSVRVGCPVVEDVRVDAVRHRPDRCSR